MKLKPVCSVMPLHLLRNEAVAVVLCSCISSLKRGWAVLLKIEFSLILILYSAASRVSRQNRPIFFRYFISLFVLCVYRSYSAASPKTKPHTGRTNNTKMVLSNSSEGFLKVFHIFSLDTGSSERFSLFFCLLQITLSNDLWIIH